MSYRTLNVNDLLERLEDEPDNESLQASRDEIWLLPPHRELIREEDFEGYARTLAHDLGYTKTHVDWLYDYIDWEKAAEALKVDYYDIEIEGVTYLYQSK